MKKTFLKSILTGVIGLTLVNSCSMFSKDGTHKCSSNACKGKKEVTDTTKADTHKCSAAKKADTKKAATDQKTADKK